MKHFSTYILPLLLLFLFACQSNEIETTSGQGTLVLDLYRGAIPYVRTRAEVDEGLSIHITRADGKNFTDGRQHIEYAAGKVPNKIVLEVGTFNIDVYSPNQDTWRTENNGLGNACYKGQTQVTIGVDETTYVTYAVPMTNYAVTLTLPELFNDLFKSYTFSLSSGGRNVSVREGEKAYFAVPEAFCYKLTATNNDDKTSSHSPIEYPDVEAGKLYNIKYVYGTSLNTGGVDIEITDNTEHEDVDINI